MSSTEISALQDPDQSSAVDIFIENDATEEILPETPSVSFNIEPQTQVSCSSSGSSEEEDIPAQDDQVLNNSDVRFNVEGRLICACKGVLSLLSPVFESMFKSNFKEREQEEIELPGKSAKALINLVKVTHSREDITVDNVYDLLPLCHEYQMERLKIECEVFLLKEAGLLHCSVNTEPMLQRYALYADIYGLPNLKDVCVSKLSKIPFKSFKDSDVYALLSSDTRMAILSAKAEANDINERQVRNIRSVYRGRRDERKFWNRHERKYFGICDITETGLHGRGSRSSNCTSCASYRYHLIATVFQ